jgi:hypothetical protein
VPPAAKEVETGAPASEAEVEGSALIVATTDIWADIGQPRPDRR